MASSEFVDPYLDPETGLLRNLVGARDKVTLDTIEGDLSFVRMVQLMDHPPPPTGDLAELKAIHGHLFQDVYDWAGQTRVVDMRKTADGAGFFLPFPMIEHATANVVLELHGERMLRGLGRGRFVERLAAYYDQLNHVHPFREGNGRTQRVFWGRVARDAGWDLDWRSVPGEANDAACRAAEATGDLEPLREMFDHIVTAAPTAPQRPGQEYALLTVLRRPTEPPSDLPTQGPPG